MAGVPCLYTAGGASSLLTGLQVYYALSDLTDATGGGLTLTNNNTVTFSAGKVGNAANFVASSNQTLTRADNAAFQMGAATDFTVAAWIKTTSTDVGEAFVCYGDNQTGYSIRQQGGTLAAFIGDGANQINVVAGGSSNDGAWHLSIMTAARAGNMTLYIDNTSSGTPAAISTIGSTNNAAGFTIGKFVLQNFLDGSVDELGIWNRILTAPEMTTLWNSGNGTTYPF